MRRHCSCVEEERKRRGTVVSLKIWDFSLDTWKAENIRKRDFDFEHPAHSCPSVRDMLFPFMGPGLEAVSH